MFTRINDRASQSDANECTLAPVLIPFTCSSGRKLKAYDAIEPLDSADSVFWVGLPL